MRRNRWAVFISGTGSNLAAALEMRDHADIVLVVSSKKSAAGIAKARRAGVPVEVIAPMDWSKVNEILRSYRVDSIFLLGFMKILPGSFVEQWKGRVLNLHPSLLPLYPGLNSIQKCFEDKNKLGVTIHEVVEQMDAGPMVLQRSIQFEEVYEDLGETEFEVHRTEQRLVREVLAKWNRGEMLS